MKQDRGLVILNPKAGRGRARNAADRINRIAKELGWKLEIESTQAPGDERRLARAAVSDRWPLVLAAGGDGTVHHVANGFLESEGAAPRLGVIPLGTGNDFARQCGVPAGSVGKSLTTLFYGTVRDHDVGFALDEYFVNGLGVGFSTAVVEATERLKFLSGLRLYLAAALKSFFGYRVSEIEVDYGNERQKDRMLLVEVSIGKTAGGGFRLTPEADSTDGLFDVCAVEAIDVMTFLRYLPSAVTGNLIDLPPVTITRVPSLTITCPTPPLVHLDGELRQATDSRLSMECRPAALRVLCGS